MRLLGIAWFLIGLTFALVYLDLVLVVARA
jgi:hypothetical protein